MNMDIDDARAYIDYAVRKGYMDEETADQILRQPNLDVIADVERMEMQAQAAYDQERDNG